VKRIVVRFNEGGIVRPFEVIVAPGMTSADILSRWGLNKHFLQNAVTNIIYPRRADLFPLISEGLFLEVVHESMVEQ